jgi:hypothetical protein
MEINKAKWLSEGSDLKLLLPYGIALMSIVTVVHLATTRKFTNPAAVEYSSEQHKERFEMASDPVNEAEELIKQLANEARNNRQQLNYPPLPRIKPGTE